MPYRTILCRIMFALVLCVGLSFALPSFAQNSTELLKPALQIDIPTITFSDAQIEGNVLKINYLGDYISGIYKYLLGFSTTIAIVMLMIGGLQWALGGVSHESISKAKTRIKNAVIGVILLLSAYLILFIVNPNLVELQFPELQNIDYEPLIADAGDVPGTIAWVDIEKKLAELGIDCQLADEYMDVFEVATSFVGKVTYRFGAKAGNPPYLGEGNRKLGSQATASFCPEGTMCADCSGFVETLRQCVGLASLGEGGGTAGIFANAEKITACGDDYISTETESFGINEGDLVGYKPGDNEKKPEFGHVWMYIGDGKVISAMGGDSGRAAGNAVQIQTLQSICKTYPLRFAPRE